MTNEQIIIVLVIVTILLGALMHFETQLRMDERLSITIEPLPEPEVLLAIIEPKKEIKIDEMIEKIIACESSSDNTKIGKAGEIGIAQFKLQTWEWMSKLADFNGDIYSEKDQLWLLKWGLESGYGRHWTCYRMLF